MKISLIVEESAVSDGIDVEVGIFLLKGFREPGVGNLWSKHEREVGGS